MSDSAAPSSPSAAAPAATPAPAAAAAAAAPSSSSSSSQQGPPANTPAAAPTAATIANSANPDAYEGIHQPGQTEDDGLTLRALVSSKEAGELPASPCNPLTPSWALRHAFPPAVPVKLLQPRHAQSAAREVVVVEQWPPPSGKNRRARFHSPRRVHVQLRAPSRGPRAAATPPACAH